MDNKKFNKGTKGNKGGRPKKADEQKLLEALEPLHPKVIQAIEYGIDNLDYRYVKLYMEYFYGRPTQSITAPTELEPKNLPTWFNVTIGDEE